MHIKWLVVLLQRSTFHMTIAEEHGGEIALAIIFRVKGRFTFADLWFPTRNCSSNPACLPKHHNSLIVEIIKLIRAKVTTLT